MDGPRYRIEHTTQYTHVGRVSMSRHITCLTPRALAHQRLLAHEIVMDPVAEDRLCRRDYFGNIVEHFAITAPYSSLTVTSRSLVEVHPRDLAVEPAVSAPWEEARDLLRFRADAPYGGAAEFSYGSPFAEPGRELADWARPLFEPGRPIIAAAVDLMHRIHVEFTFDPTATTITTPVSRVLSLRQGVCQDFAHLQIACLRSLGLAARYVSGYLLTDPPPGQPRLIGADASHAWLAVYCPRLGWIDLDPTNDLIPDARHVTLGWGRDYGDVSPLRGVVLGGAHTLRVGVSVAPSDEPDSARDSRPE